MKAKQYAVSIQYGGGYHYFAGYADTPGEARALANKRTPLKRKGRGAKPIVMIWSQIPKEI